MNAVIVPGVTLHAIPSIQRDKTGKLTTVFTGRTTLWFSYETLVAFRIGSSKTFVHHNDWAQTTGRHLNEIDGGDKGSRLSKEAFHMTYLALMNG